jgi:hypothetical protein
MLCGRKEESRKGLDRPSEETRGERPEFEEKSERICTVGSKPSGIMGSHIRTYVSEFRVCREKGMTVRCSPESRKMMARADRWHIPDVEAMWMTSGTSHNKGHVEVTGGVFSS